MRYANMIESLEGRMLRSVAPIHMPGQGAAIAAPLAAVSAPLRVVTLKKFSGPLKPTYNSTSGSSAWADTVQGTILVTIGRKKGKTVTAIQLTGSDTYLPLTSSSPAGSNNFNKTITLNGAPTTLKGKTTLVKWSSGNSLTATLNAKRKGSLITGNVTLTYGGGGGSGGSTVAIRLVLKR